MEGRTTLASTWEKVLEYASSPLHGTMSRKLRKGVSLQVNEQAILEDAQIFISDSFVRFTFKDGGRSHNLYYDIGAITSIRTISTMESD